MAATVADRVAPNAEHRRVAAQNHERARQVLNTADYSYGIELLCTCCRLDPGNLIYRKTLRAAQKKRFESSLLAGVMAFITTLPAKMRVRVARMSNKYRDVLEQGEMVLSRNPFDIHTQLAMSSAADGLGLVDTAVWILEQARQKDGENPRVNRPLAQYLEKQGNYQRAMALWELVANVNPQDLEAHQKSKDLAAMHTISKGQYEQISQGKISSTVMRDSDLQPTANPVEASANRQNKLKEKLAAKITAEPTDGQAYLQLAKIKQESGEWEEARNLLLQGMAATGQNFDLQMAVAELEIEPYRQNLRLIDQQLKSNSADAELSKQKAGLKKEINSREMEIYRKRSDRYPTEAGPRLELGIRLWRAQQFDSAIQELQQARKDPRQKWRALLYLGHCFKARKNWPLAKRNYEEALQSLPTKEDETRKELQYLLAVGAAEEKDWQRALELGNELANADFGYRNIGKLLDDWGQKSATSEPDA